MADVYLSHVPEDTAAAEELAAALTAGGFSCWPESERTPAALEKSKVVVVLASPEALASIRVTGEVVHAHESGRPCVPVLLGMSHVEMTARQPEWRVALGAATSIEVPDEGIAAIAPRVLAGVAALAAPPPRSRGAATRRRTVVVGAALVAAVGSLVVVLGGSDGDDKGTEGAGTRRTEHVIPRSTEAFSPGPLADSSTTPVATVAGNLRVVKASLMSQVCSTVSGDCRTTKGDARFVVLTLSEWDGRDIRLTDPFMVDMDRSYVVEGDRRATFVQENQDSVSGTIRVVYESLPSAAAQGQVRLAWPGSPTLALHLTGG